MSDLRVKDFTTNKDGKVTSVTLLNGVNKDYKGGLLALKYSSSVIYSFDEPSINGVTVSVYVPSATVLTKTTGTYKSSATAITYDSHDYERYATGDITF